MIASEGEEPSETPHSKPAFIMDGVKMVAAELGFVIVLKNDNSVWGWGIDDLGQLGLGSTVLVEESTSKPVLLFEDATGIAADYGHVMALKKDGTVWAWGDALTGNLGSGIKQREYYGNRPFLMGYCQVNISNIITVSATSGISFAWK